MIPIVLGSPDRVVRRLLATAAHRPGGLDIRGEAGTPRGLQRLVASQRPTVIVLDAAWVPTGSMLLGDLLARPAPPRILLHAPSLDRPNVLAAVTQGIHGCLSRDAHPDIWCQAIRAVDRGEPWIPRDLMAQALTCMRQWLPAPWHASTPMGQLTRRQHEIVRWVAQGLSNKEIGRHMGISPTTVKTHLHNIFERAGINGRQQLAVRALSSRADAPSASRSAPVR